MDYRLQNVSYVFSNYYSQPETLVKNWNKMNNSQTVHRRIVPNLSEGFQVGFDNSLVLILLEARQPVLAFLVYFVCPTNHLQTSPSTAPPFLIPNSLRSLLSWSQSWIVKVEFYFLGSFQAYPSILGCHLANQ